MKKLLLGGALAALMVLSAAPAQASITLSQGHVDAADINWVSNAFSVKLSDQTVSPAVDRDPADVILSVPAGAIVTVPNDSRFSFLGTPGAQVWILPQSQKAGLLWLGWNTLGVPSGVLQGNNLQLKLTAVTGPDDFAVYTTGAFGAPTVIFDSGNGLPDSKTVNVNTHAHANWAFEAAGTYTVTFEVTGVRTDGSAVSSGPIAYTFVVSA
ncbi:MAG TPA: hypothetical protein DGT23_12860 [Micromonosporaceae bacterium]|nr:hypothetical protein [Micromonosporaceae bacterium]